MGQLTREELNARLDTIEARETVCRFDQMDGGYCRCVFGSGRYLSRHLAQHLGHETTDADCHHDARPTPAWHALKRCYLTGSSLTRSAPGTVWMLVGTYCTPA